MATQRLTTRLVLSNAYARSQYLCTRCVDHSHTFRDGASRFRAKVIRGFDTIIAQNSTISHAIQLNTATSRQASKAVCRNDALVRELFDSLPDNIDGQTAVVAVLCAAICAMGPYDQVAPKVILLILIYIMSRSSGIHCRSLVQDVAYSAANSVTLLDALDRSFVLPIELCATRDVSFYVGIEKVYIC